jgi:hypothetical protein
MTDSNNISHEKPLYRSKVKMIRFSLPLLSTSALLIDTKIHDNTIYVSLIVFLCSMVIFGNFPVLVTLNNSKPVYYEDLYIDAHKIPTIALSDKQKDIYKSAYHAILVFSNSLLMCAIANYWLFKTSSVTSYYEIVGIIGGLLKIAGSINHSTGRMSIYIIRSCIRNQITVMASTDSLVDDEIIL